MCFPKSFLPSSYDVLRDWIVTLTIADSRFKNDVMRYFLVLSWVQLSLIVTSYFMNFKCGVLVWLTTMVSLFLTRESNIKVKRFQNFASQALKERGIHKCCSPFLTSEQLFRHWTSSESVQYSKRLIVYVRLRRSVKILCHVKTTFYFSKLSLATRLPVSWNVAQTTRSDSLSVYWTFTNRLHQLSRTFGYRKRWDRDISVA